MILNKNDYVVANIGPYSGLVKISNIREDSDLITGYTANYEHIVQTRKVIEFYRSNILTNLGPNPLYGEVYRTKIRLCKSQEVHKHFNTIYFFMDFDEKIKTFLMECFTLAYRILAKNKLTHLIKQEEIWEVHPQRGSMSGCYIRMKGTANRFNLFIKPDELLSLIEVNEAQEKKRMVHIILHELAHSADFHHLRHTEITLDWLKVFNTTIKSAVLPKEACKSMYSELKKSDMLPSKFKSDTEVVVGNQDINVWKHVRKYISQMHNVGPKELNLLVKEDDWEEIKQLWPRKDIPFKVLLPKVSVYACKNYKELICEAFAMYLMEPFTKVKLPKEVNSLMKQTLGYL